MSTRLVVVKVFRDKISAPGEKVWEFRDHNHKTTDNKGKVELVVPASGNVTIYVNGCQKWTGYSHELPETLHINI